MCIHDLDIYVINDATATFLRTLSSNGARLRPSDEFEVDDDCPHQLENECLREHDAGAEDSEAEQAVICRYRQQHCVHDCGHAKRDGIQPSENRSAPRCALDDRRAGHDGDPSQTDALLWTDILIQEAVRGAEGN